MRKPMLALILLLVVFASSVTLFAQEGLIIREIVVVGNTRTSEQVIRGQLPFKEGMMVFKNGLSGDLRHSTSSLMNPCA
ncbi:MAG TPA: hypothetical protein DCE14_03320 [Kosmotogaceae bacterium]|nr:hypothetical protein [Kosmotogaceae bacterium]